MSMFAGVLFALPLLVFAQANPPGNSQGQAPVTAAGFSAQGIFSCAGREAALPVGQLSAIQGVYVPVSDAAVTVNSGQTVNDLSTLLYKECVLDILQKRVAEKALADLVNSIITAANTKRGGAPLYVVDYRLENRTWNDETMVQFLQTEVGNICAPFQKQVQASLAREYMKQTRDPSSAFACSLGLPPHELESLYQGSFRGFDSFSKLTSHLSNNAFGAFITTSVGAQKEIEREREALQAYWDWGHGYYPDIARVAVPTDSGNKIVRRVITPSYVVSQITRQAYMSGFGQLEKADEIGEVVSATFAGLSNQIVASPEGFSGLSGGGVNSYINQLANDATLALRETATNIGLSVLANAIDIEQRYNAFKKQTLDILKSTAEQLKQAEEQCFVKVKEAVRNKAASDGVPISIPPTPQNISGGTVALTLSANTSLASGAIFTLTAPQTSLVDSASFQTKTTTGTTTKSAVDIALPLGTQVAPNAGGSATINVEAASPFGQGMLTVKLRSGQTFPTGETRFALNVASPFSAAGVSLTVESVHRFADPVIAKEVTPVLTKAEADVKTSDNALALLAKLASELGKTNTPEAQRAALEQLDRLVSQRLIHTGGDLTTAQSQKGNVTVASQELVENTVKEWTEGGNWCNVDNPNVIQEWINVWKI